MTQTHDRTSIAVLGLGAMGAAIARAAAARGHRVAGWNRTPRQADELGLDPGRVDLVDTPAEAVSDADVIVVCVRDHEASQAVLDQLGQVVAARPVVNFSTGTPAQALESAAHAADLGIRYVTGAVMVPTHLVGQPQCFAIYAGLAADLADTAAVRDALQGNSDLVGEEHDVPPALDLAMLDIYFAGMYAHLHATALAEAHGIEPARFLGYAHGIVETLGESLAGLTSSFEGGTYDGGQARLDMCAAFLEHIVASSREAGIEPGLAEPVRAASARALTRHPGWTDWDVVAQDFVQRA